MSVHGLVASFLAVVELTATSDARLTASQKVAILNIHNTLRSQVSKPCTAADMEKLVWDDDLAAKSQAWADQCRYATHELPANPEGSGENQAMMSGLSKLNWSDEEVVLMVNQWYEEIQDVDWNLGANTVNAIVRANSSDCRQAKAGTCVIGHYTQFVHAKSNKIGCGINVCSGWNWKGNGINLICKYTPGGNIMGSQGQGLPWMPGLPCAACGGVASLGCEHNLCRSNATRCVDTLSANFPTALNGVSYTQCIEIFRAYAAEYENVCNLGTTEQTCTTGELGDRGCTWMTGACSTTNIGKERYCEIGQGHHGVCDVSCGVCSTPDGVGDNFCSGSHSGSNTTSAVGTTKGSSSTGTNDPGIGEESGAPRAGVIITLILVMCCCISGIIATSLQYSEKPQTRLAQVVDVKIINVRPKSPDLQP